MFQPEYKNQFDQDGYVVARGLFTAEEAEFLKYHYTAMSETGKIQGDPFNYPKPEGMGDDPLKRYPRILQLHRIDPVSVKWLIDARLNAMLTRLLGREPYAAHAMIYFKPPKARGQALHQDNYYLRAKPGTCCAAWMALEDVDEENGCLQVVPGSHTWPTLCTVPADIGKSFTDIRMPIPAGTPLAHRPLHRRRLAADRPVLQATAAHGWQRGRARSQRERQRLRHLGGHGRHAGVRDHGV